MKAFPSFTYMLCIKKVHRHGFCFSLQKFNLELKGWSRNQVGYNLGHHLIQDIPMIPFLYGFQNSVLDEVCFLFFDSLESHGLWKICLLSIINILDAWHACCWLWTYDPPRELKIHVSERLLTKCWQKPKLYKKKDIVMNLQKLVLWRKLEKSFFLIPDLSTWYLQIHLPLSTFPDFSKFLPDVENQEILQVTDCSIIQQWERALLSPTIIEYTTPQDAVKNFQAPVIWVHSTASCADCFWLCIKKLQQIPMNQALPNHSCVVVSCTQCLGNKLFPFIKIDDYFNCICWLL